MIRKAFFLKNFIAEIPIDQWQKKEEYTNHGGQHTRYKSTKAKILPTPAPLYPASQRDDHSASQDTQRTFNRTKHE